MKETNGRSASANKKNKPTALPKHQESAKLAFCSQDVTKFQVSKNFVRWMAKDAAVLDYFAGDKAKLSPDLWESVERLRASKGDELYVDLLQALTYQHYTPEEARKLWQALLDHKYFISEKLGRNVGIKVTVLDYLDNHSGIIKDFHLLPEKDLDCLLFFVNEDGLTGLFNHRYFQEHLRDELHRCQRYNRTFSLLFVDLDHFKPYNDNLGHMKGDILLREVSAFFKSTCRDADIVARYGGDEFAFILPETNGKDALVFAKRLLENFQRQKFGTQEPAFHFPLTISVGVANYPTDSLHSEELVDAADKALYKAKHAGRNCVRVAKHTFPPPSRRKKKTVNH